MKESKRAGYERTEAMGREKVTKLLLRFSAPAIIAAEAAAGYNLFDAIWCGRLGAEALAALAVSGPLMAIFRAVGMGIGIGTASLISRYLGAGNKEEADRTACNSISIFFIVSGLMATVCLVNLRFLLQLFGAGNSVLPLAESYMFVETFFMPLDFFLVILAELIRVQGNPAIASLGMTLSSIVDLIWSPILTFGIRPFPALGIAGAAYGTVVGRAFGVAVLLPYLAFKSIYQFKQHYFVPNYRVAVNIYSIGISSTLRSSAVSISQILACRVAASFGAIPLAVLGVLFKINMIVFSFCIGISQGVLPLVGYNFGAKKKDRVREILVKAGLVSFMWGALWWVIAMLIPNHILLLFNADSSFLAVGSYALWIFALGFFGSPEIILSSFFQGIGKAFASIIVSSSRQLIFLIPCLLILPWIFGLSGLWAAYPLAGILSVTFSSVWAAYELRKMKFPNNTKGSKLT